MASRINLLKEELERAKQEIRQLKAREHQKQLIDPEIEDLKFVENPTRSIGMRRQSEDSSKEFQKRRYVSFASPPSLTHVIVSKDELLETPPSARKTKKKPLVPVIGWLFSRKKVNQNSEFSRAWGPLLIVNRVRVVEFNSFWRPLTFSYSDIIVTILLYQPLWPLPLFSFGSIIFNL